MIRISSQQVFSGGIDRLQHLNVDLNKTLEQVSTGKRVNRASDDPVAAARILKLDQEVARIETYQRNVGMADNRLQQEESTLGSIVDVLQRVRELTVQAGSGTLSANDRQSISAELQERLGQMASLANTRDSSGQYIFSGFQGNSPAFATNEQGNWVYQGDEGQRMLEIDDGVTVAISDHGKGIFETVPATPHGERTPPDPANPNPEANSEARINDVKLVDQTAMNAVAPDDLLITVNTSVEPNTFDATNKRTGDPVATGVPYTPGETFQVAGIEATITDAGNGETFTIHTSDRQSVFATVENLIHGLDTLHKSTPESQAAYNDLIGQSLANLDNAQESILLKQTEIGGRMNAVESTGGFLENSDLYSRDLRSQLQDVDYAEAISNLSFQSFVLQAAQQSFAQTSQLSLFDRL